MTHLLKIFMTLIHRHQFCKPKISALHLYTVNIHLHINSQSIGKGGNFEAFWFMFVVHLQSESKDCLLISINRNSLFVTFLHQCSIILHLFFFCNLPSNHSIFLLLLSVAPNVSIKPRSSGTQMHCAVCLDYNQWGLSCRRGLSRSQSPPRAMTECQTFGDKFGI